MSRFSARLAGVGYDRLDILAGLAIDVGDQEMTVILGPNGAGKSTAMRAFMGMVRCTERCVALDGEDVSALLAWQLTRRGIVHVPDGARCFVSLTVLENLRGMFVAARATRDASIWERSLDEVFTLFPILATKRHLAAGTLSGGQRQMLAIARALMCDPRVLLLDEPSAGLAPKIIEEMFVALKGIKDTRRCATLMAEQNVAFAVEIADNCVVIEEGRVVLAGPMKEAISTDALRSAYLGF